MSDIMSISRHRMGTDGVGVTTLVGFYGCPIKCKYCINKDCNSSSTARATYTVDELLQVLSIDAPYFKMTGGGVTFGGGEPLLQAEFIRDVCKKMDPTWRRTIETSLNVSWENVELLLNDIDYWYVDIKEVDATIYKKYTGYSNKKVLENLDKLICRVGEDKVCVRYPLIPGFNSEEKRTEGMIKLLDTIPANIQFEEFDYIRC